MERRAVESDRRDATGGSFRSICSNRRLRRDVNVPELPPRMREAERQLHQMAAVLDQALVGGIAVDLRLDAAFDRIAVDLDAPIIDEARQAFPMVEGVADRLVGSSKPIFALRQ